MTNGVLPAMSVSFGAVVSGTVSVAAGEVLILQKAGTSVIEARPGRVKGNSYTDQREMYTLTGKRIKTGSAHRSALEGRGVYLVRVSGTLKCSIRE